MGLDNPIHLVFLLVILLLVFGAKRLPEMGRSLGAGLRGFKETINGDSPHTEQLTPATAAVAEPAREPVREPAADNVRVWPAA
jgi:sec-independent protein translocase protein TatA